MGNKPISIPKRLSRLKLQCPLATAKESHAVPIKKKLKGIKIRSFLD